jgi:lipopolysaccharide transport system ATP-binding protein
MSKTIIEIENLSKSYRLGSIGGGTLRGDFSRWMARLMGRPDPTLPIGQEHNARLVGQEFKALEDFSFEVKEGEILGIIGRNGAGKSTLLKILSRVTAPTSGEVRVKGRIASLLEVGTGFHPELTGRENIFLNGAILGMNKAEIRSKFDEIVAFSGVEEFIDTPVKRYSSGMYVRLAFAVAAHLEPEILIVDEVLAVGDAEFQKKCIGKMGQVSRAGRTVILVSHNLTVVTTLCGRAVLMEAGRKKMEGDSEKVISAYIQSGAPAAGEVAWDVTDKAANNGRVRLVQARVLCEGKVTPDVVIDKPVVVQYDFEVLIDDLNVCSSIHLSDKHGTCIFASGTPSRVLKRGRYQHSCLLPDNFLNDVPYSVKIILLTDTTKWEVAISDALIFTAHETKGRMEYIGGIIGCVRPQLSWEHRALG